MYLIFLALSDVWCCAFTLPVICWDAFDTLLVSLLFIILIFDVEKNFF